MLLERNGWDIHALSAGEAGGIITSDGSVS